MLAFKVDVHGRPLPNSLEIPDYVVALGCITQCETLSLQSLDNDKKKSIKEKLTDIYRNFCDEFFQKKRIEPINYDLLRLLRAKVLKIIGWEKIVKTVNIASQNLIVAHGKEIPLAEKGQTKSFFNSLFINDINDVIKKWQEDSAGISRSLQQYLASASPEQREDLADNNVLRKYVSPQLMAPARWPCAGDYPLAINQQAAVNLALSQTSGIFSGNGPPGTGKTTLLNDIISNIIVKRACAMASLDLPAHAFEEPIKEIINGKRYTIWKPKPMLQGYEIVIASNNNNAVENISREIPSKKAIDAAWRLDYFAGLAEHILDLPECWGLCAAALGRQNHIGKFFGKFWKDVRDENALGFNDWLKECMRDKAKMQADWLQAKKEFQSTLQAHTAMCQQLIGMAQDLEQLHTVTQQLQEAEQQTAKYKADLQKLEEYKVLLEEQWNNCTERLNQWKNEKRSWWSRLMADKQWKAGYAKALDAKKAAQKVLKEKVRQVRAIQGELHKMVREQTSLQTKTTDLAKYLEHHKTRMGNHFPDNAFWQQPEEVLQKCTPWHSEKLHKLRGELFVKAMNLHRAFIGRAATQFYDNFSSMNALVVYRKDWSEKEKVLPSLWTSLCTVVPVLSTTLASIGNLKGLGKEDIGWLLIDEAGQVAPQAAVGALQRAKRAIVVGDPLQIPPIVTIPKSMSKAFREHYQLSSVWDVHNISVQQLADEANIFGTYIGRMHHAWLGAPLRVHRRCQNPMFKVANEIAYEGRMTQATPPQVSMLAQLLKMDGWPAGSYWLNVRGHLSGTNHWIPEEGAVVLELLDQMCKMNKRLPNVYIITPFKNIVASMRELLESNKERWEEHNIASQAVLGWSYRSVGTIHTFQGRQADGVILVLGASAANEGAIRWASGSPNMLNVALTRAKDFCFVVGNHNIWAKKAYFDTLANHLKVVSPKARD
ncbi:MAG: ATP-binding protein [Roseivirga sp.]